MQIYCGREKERGGEERRIEGNRREGRGEGREKKTRREEKGGERKRNKEVDLLVSLDLDGVPLIVEQMTHTHTDTHTRTHTHHEHTCTLKNISGIRTVVEIEHTYYNC